MPTASELLRQFRAKKIQKEGVSDMTADESIERLEAYVRRLYQSVIQAISLHAAFNALNESEEWRKSLTGPIAHAANIMQHAMLRELILILVRVFDKPRRKLETDDKVSFVIVGLWLEKDEIQAKLVERARRWHGEERADANERTVRDAIGRAKERLDRLANEDPNRERRLRHFRDEFLAHELHLEIPRDKPLFGHIKEMTEEIEALCRDVTLAVSGHDIAFNFVADQAREGAEALWRAVAARSK